MSTASTVTVTERSKSKPATVASHAWLVVLVTLACLVPFSNKPFNVDDPLFLWTAEQIQAHPLDFYGFKANWFGYSHSMARMMQNPPLFSYYLAAIGSLFGFSELAMHVSLLVPNVGVVLGTFFVARHFTKHPQWVALLTLFTPAVLHPSLTVMCDMTMLAFWMWAIVLWLEALHSRRASLFLVSGLLIGCSALTKYFGVSLIPLLFVYTLMRERRPGLWLAGLLVPVAMLAAYNFYTFRIYEGFLAANAISYVQNANAHGETLINGLHAFIFLGGCCVTLLFFAPQLWSWPWIAAGGAVVLLVLLATALVGLPQNLFAAPDQRQSLAAALHLTLFCLAALGLFALAFADVWRSRNSDSVFLLLWLLGTVVFAGFFNWVVAGRTLLPAAPACAMLVVRRMESRNCLWLAAPLNSTWWRLLPAMALSLAVVWGDYCFAKSLRTAAILLADRYLPQSDPLWFEGHMGFQWYLQKAGAVPLDQLNSTLGAGDLVIVPSNNTCIFALPADTWKHKERADLQASSWVSTFHLMIGADFYAAYVGVPLPYIFSRIPPEYYDVWEITRPLTLTAPEGDLRPLQTGGRLGS